MESNEIQEVKKSGKTKIWIIVLCIVLACVAVGVAVYKMRGGDEALADWQEYITKDGLITVKMPTAVTESTREVPGLGSALCHTAETYTSDCTTIMITYENILTNQALKQTSADVQNKLLTDFITAAGLTQKDTTQVQMGDIPCTEVTADANGNPAKFRVFAINANIYMAGIIMNTEDSEGLVDQYINSVEVRE